MIATHAMPTTYSIRGTSTAITKNAKKKRHLKHLEIRAKEVRCRKRCYCSVCRRFIEPKELTLNTIQRTGTGRFYFKVYCSDCYGETHYV